METKECKKCGVTLCDKNWQLIKKKDKVYIRSKCSQCIIGASFCKIKYSDLEMEKESKRRNHIIDNRIYDIKHKEIVAERSKKWRENNKEVLKEKQRERYLANTNFYIEKAYKWSLLNPNKSKKYSRNIRQRDMKELRDNYVKRLIVRDTNLSYKDVPQELIELKRNQLKLYRYGKENS